MDRYSRTGREIPDQQSGEIQKAVPVYSGEKTAGEILPLNQSQVREVKERIGRKEHVYDVADSMGISRKTVSKIKSGRSYAWAK
jgi:hypothetical protein